MPENSKTAAAKRDPRLDFFRGLAMFIIFIAHTPGNWWVNWIPARFGFSDATEIFVFCSGMASAIAFGRVFEIQGLAMGTARILHRAWQVYWAHIGLFLVIVAQNVALDRLLDTGGAYTASLNLVIFFDNIRDCILGLMTLTYVPNYFDILPMYFAILLMLPVVMWLRWQHPLAPFIFCAVIWFAAGQRLLDLPAEPWSDRPWFFNPFAWQLVFFTGFAFMRGWLPTPPIRKNWMIACGIFLLLCVPFSSHKWLYPFTELQAFVSSLMPVTTKTNLGILRYLHFLALAYVAYSAVTLLGARFSGAIVDISRKVGQQSLAVFLASLVLAQFAGTFLNLVGASYVSVTLVNLLGFAALVAVAHVVGWYKSTPWKQPRAPQKWPGTDPARAERKAVLIDRDAPEDTDDYARRLAPGTRVSPAE
jgi:hypothetical protein